MSSFVGTTKAPLENENARKKWAESDSESSGEEDANENEDDEKSVNASDNDVSESESESEDEKLDLNLLAKSVVVINNKKKAVPLTKKEKKDLRQKELEDLDSVLNDFGISSAIETKEADLKSESVVVADPVATDKPKNKKKKAAKKTTATSSQPTASDDVTAVPLGDVSSILKMRAKKATKGSNNVLSDAQKIAINEALKSKNSSTSSKKKKDKSKFSEYSY